TRKLLKTATVLPIPVFHSKSLTSFWPTKSKRANKTKDCGTAASQPRISMAALRLTMLNKVKLFVQRLTPKESSHGFGTDDHWVASIQPHGTYPAKDPGVQSMNPKRF